MENLENREMPKNNMALAIVATVLGLCPIVCCINGVLGGIAIYFATLVKKKHELGDFEGSQSAAKNAKLLSLISLGILILGIIYTALTFDMDAYNEVMQKVQEEMNK
ncbi:CD225/dispanin family protein [Flavobacteriaceae bacterium]|jgi:hypothetical protein|nr:CD225/dispanin family protein [Flavobacteriaceae bacterium]